MTVTFSTHMSKKGDTCPICLEEATSTEQWYGHQVSTDASHLGHQDCLKTWLDIKKICPKCRAPVVLSLSLKQRISNFLQSKAPPYTGGLAGLTTAFVVMNYSIQMLRLEPPDVARWAISGGIKGFILATAISFSIKSLVFGKSLLCCEIKSLGQLKQALLNIPYLSISTGINYYATGAISSMVYGSGFEITHPLSSLRLAHWAHWAVPIGVGAVTFILGTTASTGLLAYTSASRATKFIGKLIF